MPLPDARVALLGAPVPVKVRTDAGEAVAATLMMYGALPTIACAAVGFRSTGIKRMLNSKC